MRRQPSDKLVDTLKKLPKQCTLHVYTEQGFEAEEDAEAIKSGLKSVFNLVEKKPSLSPEFTVETGASSSGKKAKKTKISVAIDSKYFWRSFVGAGSVPKGTKQLSASGDYRIVALPVRHLVLTRRENE